MKNLLPIVAVLVIVGAGYYLYSNRGTQNNQEGGLPTAGEMFEGSIETAISRGTPVKCEWESEGTKATTYIKGERIYSETSSEGRMQYAIMKDNCTWTWGEGDAPSVKYCFDEADYSNFDPTEPVETTAPEGMDEVQDQEVESPIYDCAPATIPDSMFDPPSDVEFTSF